MADTKTKKASTRKNASKKSIGWNDLSVEQQANVTRKIVKHIKALAGAKYKIVQGDDQFQREMGITETYNEDYILNAYRRGRLLDLTRNAVRNSATFSAILKQLQVNTVGVNGGKAIFNYDANENVSKIRREFAKWTRESDFYDGLSFNTVLKMILNTYVVNGDMVLLFDDGLVEDSGKLMVFESDEIVGTDTTTITSKYGNGYTESLGRVYNKNGRFSGVVVSRSQRGIGDGADPDKCYFLKRNPDESMFDCSWMMPRNIWRFEQGRGISQASSSIGTILDSEDLTGFELQAAKKNSQLFAQIISTETQQEEQLPSAFDANTDFSSMTDEQIEEAVKNEVGEEEQVVSLNAARSAGIIFEQMPDGHKMELLSPNHPNDNVMEFVKWLAGRSASVFGLTQQYATLAATGADYKAERLLTEPVFKEGQKFLEGICDWVFVKWVRWATKKGIVNESDLGEDYLPNISWQWPNADELDEYKHQQAVQLKLTNMTGSFKEFYGNDWRDKLEQIKNEIQWFKDNGLPHPAMKLISGGESKMIETDAEETTSM